MSAEAALPQTRLGSLQRFPTPLVGFKRKQQERKGLGKGRNEEEKGKGK